MALSSGSLTLTSLLVRETLVDPINFPHGAAVGDFNRNGLPDIAVIRASIPGGLLQPIPIYEFQPDGSFADIAGALVEGGLPVTDFGRDILVMDVNGDGWDDLIIADHGLDGEPFPGALNRVYLSDGAGRLIDRTADFNLTSGFTHSVSAGDLDGDGQREVFFNNIGGPAEIFTIRTDGSVRVDGFNLPRLVEYTTTTMADLHGNGRDDLLLGVAEQGFNMTGAVSGYLSWTGPELAFTAFPEPQVFAGVITLDIKAVDLDGDGRLDVVLLHTASDPYYTGYSIQVLLQQADGGFRDATTEFFDTRDFVEPTRNPAGQGWGRYLLIDDVNGDGQLDLIVERVGHSLHSIFLRDGSGRFRLAGDQIGGGSESLALADITGDGAPELVMIGTNQVSVYEFDRTPVVDQTIVLAGEDMLARGARGNDTLRAGQDEAFEFGAFL
ncbi:MAG: FG-GAP repeat domain-containing protein, partial [Pseudorhodobacter sp.]